MLCVCQRSDYRTLKTFYILISEKLCLPLLLSICPLYIYIIRLSDHLVEFVIMIMLSFSSFPHQF